MGSCFLGGCQTPRDSTPVMDTSTQRSRLMRTPSPWPVCGRARLSTYTVCEKLSQLKSVQLGTDQLHCGPSHFSKSHLSSFPKVSEPRAMVS